MSLQIVEKNVFSKKSTITVTEVVLIQVFFLIVGSKHRKIKIKIRNTIAPSYHSKVGLYSRNGVIFLLFGPWSLVLYLHVWVNSKFFQ